MPRREVVAARQLGPSRWLLVALGPHDARALKAQLDPRVGVDGVVDATVVGHEAAQHLAVGGVDDGVDLEHGDVAVPHREPVVREPEVVHTRDAAALGEATLQVLVLDAEKLVAHGPRGPHVEKAAQRGRWPSRREEPESRRGRPSPPSARLSHRRLSCVIWSCMWPPPRPETGAPQHVISLLTGSVIIDFTFCPRRGSVEALATFARTPPTGAAVTNRAKMGEMRTVPVKRNGARKTERREIAYGFIPFTVEY